MLNLGVKVTRWYTGLVMDVLFGKADPTEYVSRTGTR